MQLRKRLGWKEGKVGWEVASPGWPGGLAEKLARSQDSGKERRELGSYVRSIPSRKHSTGRKGGLTLPRSAKQRDRDGWGWAALEGECRGGKGLRKGLFHSPGERQQHLGPGLVGRRRNS